MGRIFGTDGARGVAITELSCEMAMSIGRAAVLALTEGGSGGKAKIIIGKDTRISSDPLEAALVAGITSVGADVTLLGVVPTPAVAFLVKKYGASAGVMISASHNTVEYNGIKLFSGDGFKLPDETENEIESIILDKSRQIKLASGVSVGRVSYAQNAVNDYVEHLLETVNRGLFDIRIAVDCANGSASATAQKLFGALGADCIYIGSTPDGTNINNGCGSTHLENLRKAVIENECELGFAFDGDADRCLAVDGNGRVIDGDKLIAIMSNFMKSESRLSKNSAVVTVMSNLGFHGYMKKNGIATVCTKVGDRYVLEEMLKNGYNIGGEQSGHIIFLDYSTTGDGQLTAVQVLEMLSKTEKTLGELAAEIPDYPQILLNVRLRENKRGTWEQNPEITEMIARADEALGEKARILVRESGTEPLLRVMIEGENADDIRTWAENIAECAKREIGEGF